VTQPTDKKDALRGRSHAQQPPAIPREIDAYPCRKRANHYFADPARSRPTDDGAVPVGVSRDVSRDHAALGSLSPYGNFRPQRDGSQAGAKPCIGHAVADAQAMRGLLSRRGAFQINRRTGNPAPCATTERARNDGIFSDDAVREAPARDVIG
jgi:hypothetical protein